MAVQTRIYKVSHEAGGEGARLVRATHPSHALRHIAADVFTVAVASQDDLVDMLAKGVAVETIKGEQQELPTD